MLYAIFQCKYLLVFDLGPRRTGGTRVPDICVLHRKRTPVQVHRQRNTTETSGRRFRRSDIQILSDKQRELRELAFVLKHYRDIRVLPPYTKTRSIS